MKEYRIIVGKPYNNRSWISKYSKPCFLCASWTDEYYYGDKITDDYIIFDDEHMIAIRSELDEAIKDLEIIIQEDTSWLEAMKEARYQLNFIDLH